MVDACLIGSCFAMSTIKLMIFVDAEKISHLGDDFCCNKKNNGTG